ncbi:MAG: methyltransferase domain-containing protein [Chloroherpetonaceae bacterium]|nr:methyltransferase domain-containing protein [Chloroherpetonaceae bacterium]MDW8437695.1 methyltransferase domain-containing protein [Chloroherpetonaceae bacterium]
MTLDALKRRLAQEYPLAEATYEVAGFSLVLTSVADSYALLDRLSPEEFLKDEQMPYWAEIWPSSFVLSEHLVGEVGVEGKRCVELGAGVGAVSVALRKAGASVLATDYSTEALEFIRANALQNGIALDDEFQTMRLDWRDARLSEKFDVVCAADVLYERRHLLPILLAIDKLLKPDGAAFVADPRRQIAKGFLALAEENQFVVETHSRPIVFGKKAMEVDIYALKKRAADE